MRKAVLKFFLAALLMLICSSAASAATIFFAQSSAGANNGTSCANARATSSMTSGDWTAGNTIALCGTLTSAITGLGSGSSASSQITVQFQTGAGFSFAAVPTGGALILDNLSWIVVDGNSSVTCGFVARGNVTCNNGYIQSTANGSGLANQIASVAIHANNSNHIEIKNMVFGPLYLHTSASDTTQSPPGPLCVIFNGANNISIHNNTMHDAGWCLNGGGGPSTNLQIYANEIYQVDHGVGIGNANTAVSIHDNHFHDFANWDTTNNSFHHDGIHIFGVTGAIGNGVQEYNNLFDGDMGNNVTAWIYNEGLVQNVLMFNNIAYVATGRNSCCGVIDFYGNGYQGSGNQAFNNTVFGPGYTSGTGSGMEVFNNTNAGFRNNVVNCCQQVMSADGKADFASGSPQNDAYEDVGTTQGTGGGANTFSCGGNQFESVATWQTCSAGDSSVVFATTAALLINQSTGLPAIGSPVCGAGQNLTSLASTLGIPALTADAAGNPRPSSGAWDAGALNCPTSGGPALTFSQSTIAFPNTVSGGTSPATVLTLSNPGSASTQITAIQIIGANPTDFSIGVNTANTCNLNLPLTIMPGTSCTLNPVFIPQSAASFTANLTFTDNVSINPQTVTMTGTGIASAPAVAFAPPSIAFPNTVQSVTSSAIVTTLTNTGTATLNIGVMAFTGTNAADFAVSATTCSSTLTASSSCTISITFTPGATGSRSAFLNVPDNAPGSPQTLAVSGTGISSGAAITLSPTSLSFGTVPQGTASASQAISLTNSGSSNLTTVSVSVTGTNAADFGQTNGCAATIAPGSGCTITVTFTPSTTSAETASVSISSNISTVTAALSGTGAATAPGISFTPPSLGFGNQITSTTSPGMSTTIKNTGTATMTISGITLIGTNAAYFSISANTCGGTLSAGSTCTVTVTFTPATTGTFTASINVADNVGDGHPDVVALTGTGVASAAPSTQQDILTREFVANSSAGTTTYGLVTLTSSGAAGTPLGATKGAIGICVANCGTSGTATIQYSGTAQCLFDGSTTEGDYFGISATTGNHCADVGVNPVAGTYVYGHVKTTNSGAGTYAVLLLPESVIPAATTATSGVQTVFGRQGPNVVAQTNDYSCAQVTGCTPGAGLGTVSSVATSSPLSGGPVTTTGTISCPTCVTSGSALTSGQLMTGAGGQGSQVSDLSGDVATSGSTATTLASKFRTRDFGTTFGDTTGSALSSGSVVYFTVPYACTIAGWNITVDAGTVTFDIWKIATGTAIPTVTNTITASAKPALSTGTALHSTTLTGWTTSVSANDIFGIQLNTVATAKYAEIDIQCNQ